MAGGAYPAMSTAKASDAERRRAWRRDLRSVSRLLRGAGLLFVILGLGGLLVGGSGDWWVAPSWFSLAIGLALFVVGGVQRVRNRRKRADSLPES